MNTLSRPPPGDKDVIYRKSNRSVKHPNYNSNTLVNDIAVVVIAKITGKFDNCNKNFVLSFSAAMKLRFLATKLLPY
jgi:hypothetical protein